MSERTARISAQERCDIEALVNEHAWRIDSRNSAGLAELYTEDGRLLGRNGVGLNCKTPAEITAYGEKAATRTHLTVRHVCTNLRLTRLGADRIQGQLMIGLVRSAEPQPYGDPTPIALADAEDIYRLCPDGEWRIEERVLSLAFEAPAHRQPG